MITGGYATYSVQDIATGVQIGVHNMLVLEILSYLNNYNPATYFLIVLSILLYFLYK